jgi:endonuclease/exonuclease/phosphatase family metal-dependent hydrolase
VRVGTWNLLHGLDIRTGRVDLGAVADAVLELDVEVLAVQEVDRGLDRSGGTDQLAALADKLGWFGEFAPTLLGEPVRSWDAVGDRPDPGGPAYGIGLLSPHPLHDVRRLELPGGAARRRRRVDRTGRFPPLRDREPRTVLRARVSPPDGPELVVASTHLSYVVARAVLQLRRTTPWLGAAGAPGVLLGDLNLPHRLLGPALAGTGWTPGRTAEGTFPSWRPGMQLDHVVVRGGALRDTRAHPPGPSDHRAVTAELDIR